LTTRPRVGAARTARRIAAKERSVTRNRHSDIASSSDGEFRFRNPAFRILKFSILSKEAGCRRLFQQYRPKRDDVEADRQPNPRYSRSYEKLPGCSTDHRQGYAPKPRRLKTIEEAHRTAETRHNRTACVIAWQFWNAPNGEVRLLRRLQARRCGQTGRRLWKGTEVDTVFRCFEYGKNTETIRGRGWSIFGACQIFR
jgi:hypothetical protein